MHVMDSCEIVLLRCGSLPTAGALHAPFRSGAPPHRQAAQPLFLSADPAQQETCPLAQPLPLQCTAPAPYAHRFSQTCQVRSQIVQVFSQRRQACPQIPSKALPLKLQPIEVIVHMSGALSIPLIEEASAARREDADWALFKNGEVAKLFRQKGCSVSQKATRVSFGFRAPEISFIGHGGHTRGSWDVAC